MKKLLVLFAAAAIIGGTTTTALQAQVYVAARAGYSFSVSPEVRRVTTPDLHTYGGLYDQTANGATYSYKNIYGSAGAGLNGGVAVGYMFNEHFGVELAGNYFSGNQQDFYNGGTYSAGSYPASPNHGGRIYDYIRVFRVLPSLVVTGGSGKVSPYARFGICLPLTGTLYSEVKDFTSRETTAGLTYERLDNATLETKGDFSLGFNSAIGVNIKLSDKLTLFGEAELITQGIKAKSSTVTSFNSVATAPFFTGGSFAVTIDDLPTALKQVTYVDEITQNSNVVIPNSNAADLKHPYVGSKSNSQPSEQLSQIENFNSLGINVGVKYRF